MTIRWESEACELARDKSSGASIARVTSSVMSNINIYYEQPYGSADGKRFVYLRAQSSDPRLPPGQQLCVADIERLKICLVDDQVRSNWIATTPWSGHVFYLRTNGELIHFDMDTLEKRIALTHWPLQPNAYLWSVSPDLRYLVTITHDADFHCNLVRVDLHTRKHEVIFRSPFIHGHVQVNHVNGKDILLQTFRGRQRNHIGDNRTIETDQPGSTHVVVDLHTGVEQQIKIGEPWTAPSTGHASWVAGTGKMATPVGAAEPICVGDPDKVTPPKHDPRHPEGNFLVIGPGDEKPYVFPAAEHLFNHSSMSRCGRYFVADCFCNGLPGPVEIVVGNIQTGKHRILIADCGAQGGGPACSHPHPYFSADNRYVIYNADPHHVCHVHVARVPDDFLKSLD